jgi:SAM-dependent methyltransferase
MGSVTALQENLQGAFDEMAEEYDNLFTWSKIGMAQRSAVWKKVNSVFAPGTHILELNCGTGEDALFLARMGVTVTACDASSRMIQQARLKRERQDPSSPIQFEILPTERLRELRNPVIYDGVFSNFSGLNCVPNLAVVAEHLACRVKNGAPLLLCLSTRVCLWEIIYFILRGNPRKAFRRCPGQTVARVGRVALPIHYPTLRELRKLFGPEMRLRSCTGIGITVPPSFAEPWAKKHPKVMKILQRIDEVICDWPLFRVVGDHMLLHFDRVNP